MSLPDRDPELAHRLVESEGGLLLDVRSAEEFAGGHPEGALNIPHTLLPVRASELGDDKSRPIVVYCAMGGRAGMAKQWLLSQGFEKVTNLGGVGDW